MSGARGANGPTGATPTTSEAALAVVTDASFHEHTVAGHPENEARLTAIEARLEGDRSLAALPRVVAEDVETALLLAVHSDRHLLSLQRLSASGGGWIDADTYCTARSWMVARRAAGATVAAVDAVLGGRARHAFAVVRPPGHHATPRQAMGFCLLNNVAVAARAAQSRHGLGSVAIVDIDVHHGNGTQEAFEEDGSVLYCSLHQWPLYPGTGGAEETGRGAGAGMTVNVPLPPGTGGPAWLAAFREAVVPALHRVAPELILVSAGFDAHAADPLAELALTEETYAEVAGLIAEIAAEHCGGRTVWALEGGYDLEALPASVAGVLGTLGGIAVDPV